MAVRRRPGGRDARAEGEGRRREGERRGLRTGVRHHRLRAARRHARERRRRLGRSGAPRVARPGRGGYRRGCRAHGGLVRFIGGAVGREHLARHAGGERVLHRVARTEGRLRPRGAMQRRDRHRRRVCHRGRERRRDEDPRADAGVRVVLRGHRGRAGARTAGAGGSGFGARPGGARDDDRAIVRSGRRRRGADTRRVGVAGWVGWIVNGSISSVSGRWISLDSSRLVSPAGIVEGRGRDVRRGRRRRRERPALGRGRRGGAGRRRELHRLDDGVPGRLELEHFPIVELVLDGRPHERRRGVVVGGMAVSSRWRPNRGRTRRRPGAAGSAFTGRPAGSASGEGVFRIVARVFTLIPSRSSVKAPGAAGRSCPLFARLIPASTFAIQAFEQG